MLEARAKRDGTRDEYLLYCRFRSCPEIVGRLSGSGFAPTIGYVERVRGEWEFSKYARREGPRSRRPLTFDDGQRCDLPPRPRTVPLDRLPNVVRCRRCGRSSYVRATTAPVADWRAPFAVGRRQKSEGGDAA